MNEEETNAIFDELEEKLDKQYYFNILDELRDSGAINMLDAPQYLEQNLLCTKHEARTMVMEWIKQNIKDAL